MQQKQKMAGKKQQNPNVRRNLDPFANKVNKPKQSNNEKSEMRILISLLFIALLVSCSNGGRIQRICIAT